MQTYIVNWSIEVYAENADDAAAQALEMQRDINSSATVFDITDESGVNVQVDLFDYCE